MYIGVAGLVFFAVQNFMNSDGSSQSPVLTVLNLITIVACIVTGINLIRFGMKNRKQS